MLTVGQPSMIEFEPPTASMTGSPCRAAGSPPMITVRLPLRTTPGPCGGGGMAVHGHIGTMDGHISRSDPAAAPETAPAAACDAAYAPVFSAT